MTFEFTSDAPDPATSMNSSAPGASEQGSDQQDVSQKISTKVRFTTITWGLILLSLGVAMMTLAAGYIFDTQLALIIVLAVAGITLLGGSLVRSIRK